MTFETTLLLHNRQCYNIMSFGYLTSCISHVVSGYFFACEVFSRYNLLTLSKDCVAFISYCLFFYTLDFQMLAPIQVLVWVTGNQILPVRTSTNAVEGTEGSCFTGSSACLRQRYQGTVPFGTVPTSHGLELRFLDTGCIFN